MNAHCFLTWLLVLCLLLPALPVQAQDTPDQLLAPQDTYTVNSNGDQPDAYIDDLVCDTQRNPSTSPPTPPSGLCTLRAAIQTANRWEGRDTIFISREAGVIQPASALPDIRWPVTIDGAGAVLDGSLLTTDIGLWVSRFQFSDASGSTIRNLTIRNFDFGVSLSNGVTGVTVSGSEFRQNAYAIAATSANTITQNTIVQNNDGIWLKGNDNRVTGNKIGTDGVNDLGNARYGIKVDGSNNLIGGATGIGVNGSCTGDCNLIAGNGGDGIAIAQGSADSGVNNIIRGNFIGVNLLGAAAIPNDGNGIVTNGDNNQIIGNLIAGNGVAGRSEGANGIFLINGAAGNIVRGNLIGTKIDGMTPLGNYEAGVNVYFANQNMIGADAVTAADVGVSAVPTTCTGDCNVILGNGAGISITQAVDPGLNKIIGNFIGVAANGLAAPGNLGNGIFMQGLTTTVSANVIAGNSGSGIEIRGVAYGTPQPINQHVVQGNYIGVLPDGVTQAGNTRHGIFIDHSADNWIGGTEASQRNVIAYNGAASLIYDGVVMTGTNAINNRILRNSIYDNGAWSDGHGIDLGADGPTPNDATDSDVGPNNLQNYPVITRLQGATVTGVLTSTANSTFRLEFFGSPTCAQIGYGQGKDFLGSFDVTTDANGRADFQQALATAPAGRIVTATATDPNGNTSEFSACYGGLIVNSVGDAPDATANGVCDTGNTIGNGDQECTLRAAIFEANGDPDLDTIIFDIPGVSAAAVNAAPVIMPNSALPTVMFPVVIDGRTQPGGYVIIDGWRAGDDVGGLSLIGGNSQVRGLSINGFRGYGIKLDYAGDNVIAGNFIGLYPDGSPAGNGRAGIQVLSSNNRIGGATPEDRNVIGANGTRTGASGIYITLPATNTQVLGNLIGVLANGTLRGNALAGIYIENSPGNTIGDATSTPTDNCRGACNAIAGNRYGIMLNGVNATNNQVKGNFVGVNPAGATAAPNSEYGVIVDNAPTNVIAHNVIGGNGAAGAQAAALTSGDGVVLNGAGATGNFVIANTIGIDPTGTWAIGNARHGIWIEQAPANMIDDNLISGNGASGVMIHGGNAAGNVVVRNQIGVAGSGAAAIANTAAGVTLDGARDNTIGGNGDNGNLISGNQGHGVHMTGNAQNNTVDGNRIGVNDANTAALPNGGDGVRIDGGASRNTVGSVTAEGGNIISGNTGNGVQITGEGAQNNTVAGNTIGLNIMTNAPLPNDGDGVRVADGASSNTVGGGVDGDNDANVIVGNGSDGVQIDGAGTINNIVAGNYIGVLADASTAIANSGHGVYISGGANSNTVGAALAAHGNVIARNGGDGVYVAAGLNNAIWQNRIFRNSGLGIDLGENGVTLNDALDPDVGPNLLQNFPLLASVQVVGETATLKGTLESTRTTTFRLDFYANRQCNPSGFGEGETPLGSIEVTTDANGWASFTYVPTATVTSPVSFTVTATDPNRNTSEFSPCAGPSTEAAITPAGGGALHTGDVSVTVPAGAVAADVTLALQPLPMPVNAAPEGMGFGGLAFLLNAFVGGVQQQNFTFQQPVRVTVHYSDAAIAGLDENTLTLHDWNGTAWADAATTCTPTSTYDRQPATNQLSVNICHLTPYALMGPQRAPQPKVYLPVIVR
ncbi:MAG TPA: hypothetical protein GYA08_03965 [Chloroflexi bacterium]|nr:hypothetical protein [Chloroflexota bacterium]